MPKQVADVMGHTLDTHLSNYARFMTRDLDEAFAAANQVDVSPSAPQSALTT